EGGRRGREEEGGRERQMERARRDRDRRGWPLHARGGLPPGLSRGAPRRVHLPLPPRLSGASGGGRVILLVRGARAPPAPDLEPRRLRRGSVGGAWQFGTAPRRVAKSSSFSNRSRLDAQPDLAPRRGPGL